MEQVYTGWYYVDEMHMDYTLTHYLHVARCF